MRDEKCCGQAVSYGFRAQYCPHKELELTFQLWYFLEWFPNLFECPFPVCKAGVLKANNQKEFLEINNMLAEVKNSMKELKVKTKVKES